MNISSPQTPFLYGRLASQILGSPGNLLYFGGPGMGKSAIIDYLHQRCQDEGRLSVKIRAVRAQGDAGAANAEKERLLRWLAEPEGLLLIDDLDRVYTKDVADAFCDTFDAGFGVQPSSRIIATSGTPKKSEFPSLRRDSKQFFSEDERALNMIMVDSRGLAPFDDESLNPWTLGWCSRASRRVSEVFVKTLSGGASENGRLADVVEAVVRGSGGHPALLGAATSKALRELLGEEAHEDAHVEGAERERLDRASFERMLEDHLITTQGGLLYSASVWVMRQLGIDRFRGVIEFLDTGSIPADRLLEAKLCRTAGLAFEGEDGRWTFSCAFAKAIADNAIERVLEESAAPAPAPTPETGNTLSITLEPDKVLEQAGSIRWFDGDQRHELALTPVEWDVVKALHEINDPPTSVATLERVLKESDANYTAPAIRSAINRLAEKCNRNGIGWVIRNIPRQGYVLSTKLGSAP